MPNDEALKAEIERLRAENEALKRPRGQMSLKVSEKGACRYTGSAGSGDAVPRAVGKTARNDDEIRQFHQRTRPTTEEEGVTVGARDGHLAWSKVE